jgi:hypothetical protein
MSGNNEIPGPLSAQLPETAPSAPAPPGAHAPLKPPPQGSPMGVLSGPRTQPHPRDVRSWYVPLPSLPGDDAGPGEGPAHFVHDGDLFTRITPGFILESLPRERTLALANSPVFPESAADPPRGVTLEQSRTLARRMLASLTAEDLRRVARRLRLPEDGGFVDLYRRLSLLC